MVSIIYAV